MKYHVNSKTGRAGQCRATKKGCPLGADTPHFDTKEEAKTYIEKSEAASHEKFASMSKKGSSGGSGNSKNKTLIGTPDPDNGDELSENLTTSLKDIKKNADFIISNSSAGTPYNEGVRDASERISEYHNEAFKNGYDQNHLKNSNH